MLNYRIYFMFQKTNKKDLDLESGSRDNVYYAVMLIIIIDAKDFRIYYI